MRNNLKIVLGLVVVALGVWVYFVMSENEVYVSSYEECVAAGYPIMESYPERCKTPGGKTFVRQIDITYPDLIRVDAPASGDLVTSPITITGEARGSWYFEASFPVKLVDANGRILAQGPAQAQGEWMTPEFVPFTATWAFSKPTTDTGTLILRNDNASGLPENDKEIEIPVRFAISDFISAEFGKSFKFGTGGKASFSDGLSVTLKEVNDSRCKPDVQCVWAGELSALILVTGSDFNQAIEEVRLGTTNNKSVLKDSYLFALESATEKSATILVEKVAK